MNRLQYAIYIVSHYILEVMGRVEEPRTPLREPTFFILAAMLDGPIHGYGIIKRIQELSERRVKLAAGTLYGALDRLTEEGLVEVEREEIVDGRARRYYRLTGDGREALRAEAMRMESAAGLVLRPSLRRS